MDKKKSKCEIKLDDEAIVMVMKYLDLKDILTLLIPLNKEIKELVASENYLMFKKFLHFFCIDTRLKRNALPAHNDIM